MSTQTSCVRQVRRDTYRTIYASYVAITGSTDGAILLDLVVKLTDSAAQYAREVRAENEARKKEGLKPLHSPDGSLYHTAEEYAKWSAGALTVNQIKKLWPILEGKGIVKNLGRHPELQWSSTVMRRLDVEKVNKLLKEYEDSLGKAKRPAPECETALSLERNGSPASAKSHALLITQLDIQSEIQREGEGSYLNSTQPPAAPTRNQAPPFEDFSDNSNELEPLKREIGKACGIRKSADVRTEDELSRQAITLKAQRITPEAIRETVKANPSKVFKLKFFAEDILGLHAVTWRAAEPEPEDLRTCKADNCVGGTVREWLESGKYRDRQCPECKGKGKVPVQIRARQEEAARRRAAANVDQLLSF